MSWFSVAQPWLNSLGLVFGLAGASLLAIRSFRQFTRVRLRNLNSDLRSLSKFARRWDASFKSVPPLLEGSVVVRQYVEGYNRKVGWFLRPQARTHARLHNLRRRSFGLDARSILTHSGRLSMKLVEQSIREMRAIIEREDREADPEVVQGNITRYGLTLLAVAFGFQFIGTLKLD